MKPILKKILASGALGGSQVTPSTLLDGLVNWWEASEGPANLVNSVSGAPDLVYTQGATAAQRRPFVSLGFGTRAQTANSFLTAAAQANLNGTGSFTVAGWFFIQTTGAQQVLAAHWGTTLRRWRIYYNKADASFKCNISVTGSTTATTLSVAWPEADLLAVPHLLIFEHDAENDFIRLKIGNLKTLGAFTSTAHSTGVFNGTAQKFAVAGDNDSLKLDGYIGRIGMWNRKLTSDEHTELWNSGRGLSYPFTAWNNVTLSSTQFNFIVVPDSQHMVTSDYQRTREWGWQISNIADLVGGIDFVAHVGDVRHKILPTDPNVANDWVWVKSALQRAIDKGMIVMPQYGNHDLDDIGKTGPGRRTTEYDAAFPQSYLTGQTGWSGGFYDSNLHNYYYTFTAGGIDWMLISLELCPRDAVLAWAANLVATNPTKKVIYISHQILSNTTGQPGGTQFMDSNDNTVMGSEFNPMGERNNGSTQYNTVLKPYSNSVMMLCGHDVTSPCNGDVTYTADNGNKVVGILRNYQEEDSFSSTKKGWFVVVTVDTAAETIRLRTYSVPEQTFDNWTAGNLEISPADQNKTISYAP